MKETFVKDWMSRDVITISPDMPLPEADKLMSDRCIRRLPVVVNGEVVGIVTRGDVRGAEPSEATTLSIWELNYLLSQLKIRDLMSKNPMTIRETATIGEAAQLMMSNKVSGLPVLDASQKLVGVITESDIFRMVASTWQGHTN